TTLTSTAAALNAGPGAQAWILSGMSVGAGAGVLVSGAIGDDYGRRRTFVAGALVLALASVVGAVAPTGWLLVLARLVQGLGGAAILACGLGLVGQLFPSGPARARATGIWAAALGAGVALGPLLSAGLADVAGWRAPYVLTALAGVALAWVARAYLPESRAAAPRRIDIAGTLLLGSGTAAFLSGLVEARMGWERPLPILLVGAGLILLGGFIAAERRIREPMLDLSLFRRPDFVSATVAALAAGAGLLSLMTVLPTLLERAMDVSTLMAATLLLAWSATSVFSAYGVRWLPERLTPQALLVADLIGSALGQVGLFALPPDNVIVRVLPALLVAGIAYGVLNAALGRQAVASVPRDRTAMGGGANNTARFLGSSMGLTVISLLVTHGADRGAAGLISGWNIATLASAGISLVGAIAVTVAGTRKPPHGGARSVR
ncbi:MAG: MFS transporter, partial [Pseudolabrys sp.]